MWGCMGLYVMIGGMIDVKQFSPFFLEDHQRGSNQGVPQRIVKKTWNELLFWSAIGNYGKTGVVMRF